eukprot:6815867-Pyramimonas_sp.AAC.1
MQLDFLPLIVEGCYSQARGKGFGGARRRAHCVAWPTCHFSLIFMSATVSLPPAAAVLLTGAASRN